MSNVFFPDIPLIHRVTDKSFICVYWQAQPKGHTREISSHFEALMCWKKNEQMPLTFSLIVITPHFYTNIRKVITTLTLWKTFVVVWCLIKRTKITFAWVHVVNSSGKIDKKCMKLEIARLELLPNERYFWNLGAKSYLKC